MFLESLLQDVRIGLRVLVKEKSFCALAVAVLALGISAVTTMFSVVNGTLIRGFSFPNADRLMSINFIDPSQNSRFGFSAQMSSMDFEELSGQQKSFERVAAYLGGSTVNVTLNGNPLRFFGAYVTPDFLRALGVAPALGRDFTPEDNKPGAEKVALISHQIWQREFGGRPDIVGTSIRLNGRPSTIIGVMAPGFSFPNTEQLWIPLYSEYPVRPRSDRGAQGNFVAALGLLRPDVSLDQANVELSGIAQRFATAYPDTNKLFNRARIEPLINAFTGAFLRGLLLTMLGFCVGVLLIACVNVMNMQFARATLRGKELAVRSSLGASRTRLIRQMLTESLLVATLGALLGVGFAAWAVDYLDATLHALENPIPAYVSFDLDPVVLAFVVGATFLAAIVSGLVPAWLSSRINPSDVLKESGRGNTGRTITLITRSLVVFQILITCVLLISSLLQLRSILAQQRIDYGYDTEAIMSARMGLMDGDYPNSEARRQFYDRLLRQLRAHPQIEGAALTNRYRMVFSGNSPIEIEGKTYATNRDRPNTNFEQVSPGYFDVTAQKLREGRDFDDADLDSKQPVAIVNASFAKKHFGGESAIGRRFRVALNNGTSFGAWRTIVGVVTDVRMLGPFNNSSVDASGYYAPLFSNLFAPASATAGAPPVPQFTTLAVRTRGGQPGSALLATLNAEVKKADPNLPLYYVNTPKAHQDGFTAQNRINAMLFTIFGGVAVVLASIGLYGVTSFSVNQRTQEFGIRMALGADSLRILRMVLRQGGVQLALGLVLGFGVCLGIAAAFGNTIQGFLFDTTPHDPVTYASVALLLTVVSLTATLIPARRASRVDPMRALRSE